LIQPRPIVARHPEVAAKRPSKGDGPGDPAVRPSRLATLAPQDDGTKAAILFETFAR